MGVDPNDWRLDRLKGLQGQAFRSVRYHAPGEEWDHDHCVGCWAKFAEYDAPDILHQGYIHAEPYKEGPEPEFITDCKEQGMRYLRKPAVDGFELYWVCPRCFDDFRELLDFTLEP